MITSSCLILHFQVDWVYLSPVFLPLLYTVSLIAEDLASLGFFQEIDLNNTYHPKNFSLRPLLHYIKSQKSDFWHANLYTVLSTLALLPIPMLIPLLIDEVLLGHPGKMTAGMDKLLAALGMIQGEAWLYIAFILAVVMLLRLLGFVFSTAMAFYATKITQKISYMLRHRVLHHLERVSIAEYETLKPGGVAARTTQDVDNISGFTGMMVTTFLSAALMFIGIAAIMFWMSWILALLVFILNPLFLGFSRIIGKKTGEYLKRQNEAYELYHEALHETLDLFVQVRASNQERSFFGLLQNLSLIHISEPTRPPSTSRMPSSA